MVVMFEIVLGILIWLSYIQNRKLLNPMSIITIPYMFIIPINNWIAIKYGFYPINDETIIMHMVAFIMFFSGSSVISISTLEYTKDEIGRKLNKFNFYNMNAMCNYALAVESVIAVRAIKIILGKGMKWFVDDANEGYLMTGPCGHLMLTLYVVLPIIFYYWLKNKKKIKYGLSTIIGISLIFMTFVKYHVICLVVLIYLFCAAEDARYLKKGALAIVIICCGAFVSSYVVTFILRKSFNNVNGQFYLYHLWKYIGGSLINNNLIFTEGIRIRFDCFYKLGSILMALPNMFIVGLFGKNKVLYVPGLEMFKVAENGEASNVVDLIGYIFPSKGDAVELLFFCLIIFLFGAISQVLYNNYKRRIYEFTVSTWVFITFFCFFSFFAVYGTLSNPWEILVYSMIIPQIFNKKIRLNGRKLWNE